jgi:hypothetical protein
MRYEKLSKRPNQFFRFTGFTVPEFDWLVKQLAPLWQKAEIKRLSQKNRKRAGRIALLLLFYKIYPIRLRRTISLV